MALGDRYATLADLKARLTITNSNDDSRLTYALDTATANINGYCNRQFNDAVSTSTRLYRPDSAYVVSVDDFSTTVGLQVTVNNAPWTLDSQYEVDPLNGVVDGEPGWPYSRIHGIQGSTFYPVWPGKANIAVTARWGWAAVPSPVREACLILAEENFKLRDTPFGVGGYGAFGIVQVRNNPFVARMLDRYARYPVMVL